MSNVELLKLSIQHLKIITLWPGENDGIIKRTIKDLLYLIFLLPMQFGVYVEAIREISGLRDETKTLLTALLHFSCALMMLVYTLIFYYQRGTLKYLQIKLRDLEIYSVPTDIVQRENICRLYSVTFNVYIFVGASLYVLVPFADMKNCREKQEMAVYTKHIPCGIYGPLWYPFSYNYSPVFEIVVLYSLIHAYVYCFIVSECFLMCTFIVLHIIGHLRNLKKLLNEALCRATNKEEEFIKCVRYHIAIIEYCSYIDKFFSLFNFALVTLASFIFGILEYQMLTSESLLESTRYIGHLIGWTFVLFIVNNSAQCLLEESVSIADELYQLNWTDLPVSLQKDVKFMILRSQKPITLSTGPFGILGREMFLGVMKTAYSYFALVANFK